MKILKQLSAAIVLALFLSASAYAGDVSGPVGAPAPGDMSGPSSAPAPGDMSGPTLMDTILGLLAGF